MMILSLVAMTVLEKCCITSAYLQWLFHSGEWAIDCGPLVLFFPENRIWYFMQIVSISKPVFWEKIRKIFQHVVCWKFNPECYALFLAHLSTKCSWWAIVVSQCPSCFVRRASYVIRRAASTIALKAYSAYTPGPIDLILGRKHRGDL